MNPDCIKFLSVLSRQLLGSGVDFLDGKSYFLDLFGRT
jgi:hypothetical protein